VGISFFRFVIVHAFDRRTDGQTDRRTDRGLRNALRCVTCSRTVINYSRVTLYAVQLQRARHARGAETYYRIVLKFCTGVGVPDLATHAKFNSRRFRGFEDSGGWISHFSIKLHWLTPSSLKHSACDFLVTLTV